MPVGNKIGFPLKTRWKDSALLSEEHKSKTAQHERGLRAHTVLLVVAGWVSCTNFSSQLICSEIFFVFVAGGICALLQRCCLQLSMHEHAIFLSVT
jgi:hypothetical protein